MSLILDLQVDMDMEDDDSLGVPSTLDEGNIQKVKVSPQEDNLAYGMSWIYPKGHLYLLCIYVALALSLLLCPHF